MRAVCPPEECNYRQERKFTFYQGKYRQRARETWVTKKIIILIIKQLHDRLMIAS